MSRMPSTTITHQSAEPATGLHRAMGSSGLPNDVKVAAGTRCFTITEAEYRRRECLPYFEDLSWETVVSAFSKGSIAMRTTRAAVTFDHPFTLKALDGMQPPGTYLVITEEEELPGLSFEAWKRVSTVMYLPAMGVGSGLEQVVTIDPEELASAVRRDTSGGVQ